MKLSRKALKPILSPVGNDDNSYLCVLDEKGNILLTNATMQKELNLKNPQQEKANLFDLLHPVHIEDLQKGFRNAMKSCNPYSMEFYLKNGVYHNMKWQIRYLPGNSDPLKIFLCKGTMADTVQEDENPVLTGTETVGNMFRAFMNKSSNLAWVVDEEANLLFANPAFYNFFRLDETAVNKKINRLVPLAIADIFNDNHLKVLQTGWPVEKIVYEKLPDGRTVSFQVNLFLLEEASGKKIVGGIAIDRTEIHQTENKLKETNERLRNLNRITADAVWEWDMKTGKVFRNERLLEMTGRVEQETPGVDWWISRIHPEDRVRVNETIKKVVDNNLQSWESEYRFLCADGEYKNVHDHGVLISKNGKPIKMIGSLHDITNETLLETLFTEEQLRQHKNISEAVIRVHEQERSRLGRELHDNVNQILSIIKMFVGMLTPFSKEEKEIKKKAIEHTQLAIDEIRKLSREMVSPHLEGGSLKEHISNVIADLEFTSNLKIKFTHDAETELLSPGKKVMLFRVFQEQIKNILKYSKADKVEILLQSKDKFAQLIITDNGVGFDTTQTSSGVGLASIQDRVNFYKGKVEILSAPGKGCQTIVSIALLD